MKAYKKMKMRILMFLNLFLFLACNSTHFTMSEMAGTYNGNSKNTTKRVGYNFALELQKDSICRIRKTHDIYNITGIGKWYIKDKFIIIEYEKNTSERLEDVLRAGGYLEGEDTLSILNINTIKIGTTVLRKR